VLFLAVVFCANPMTQVPVVPQLVPSGVGTVPSGHFLQAELSKLPVKLKTFVEAL
jgi:hypothetical protein